MTFEKVSEVTLAPAILYCQLGYFSPAGLYGGGHNSILSNYWVRKLLDNVKESVFLPITLIVYLVPVIKPRVSWMLTISFTLPLRYTLTPIITILTKVEPLKRENVEKLHIWQCNLHLAFL